VAPAPNPRNLQSANASARPARRIDFAIWAEFKTASLAYVHVCTAEVLEVHWVDDIMISFMDVAPHETIVINFQVLPMLENQNHHPLSQVDLS
jgi:hypothetical protein